MIKRIARIWPLWLIMLAAYFALLRFDLSFFSDQSKFTWLLRSIALLPGGHVEGDAAPVYGFPILSVGWTLTYEMYFYLLFGACMLFGRWRWIAMTGWLFLTVIAVPYSTGQLDMLLLPAAGPVYASHVASLITNPLILKFAAGSADRRGLSIGLHHQQLHLFVGGNVPGCQLRCVSVCGTVPHRPWHLSVGTFAHSADAGDRPGKQAHGDPSSTLAYLAR